MFKRRTFIAFSGSTLCVMAWAKNGKRRRVVAKLAAPTVASSSITKFVTPLLIPPAMPQAGKLKRKVRGQARTQTASYYEISMRQFTQQMLPAPWPATKVWGYGPVCAADKKAPMIHNAPSLTIEAQAGTPVVIKWINELKTPSGQFLPHLLPVDPTLHWANPPGGTSARDTRPRFTATPGRYNGPVPIVTHVHGAVGVGDESDGYAEAWFLPSASNIPASYATRGTWYDFMAAKSSAQQGTGWGPGFSVFDYPNTGRAVADWYHDHTLGMTRLNVYAGPAGFYIVRGGPGGDGAVIDRRSSLPATLPGPAPCEGDPFPSSKPYGELVLAIQDRAFNPDGSLFYPDSRALFDGITGPYIPSTDVSPIWNPEFFGNTLIVNGRTWPYQTVEQRRYRLRVLNGCGSRFLMLSFASIPGVQVWQIGNDGGFLAAPVNLGTANAGVAMLAPAERADLIVDFSGVAMGAHVLRNLGPDGPYAGGAPGIDFPAADPLSTGQVMQFRVVPATTGDRSTPPAFLRLPALVPLPAASVTRRLALLEEMSPTFPGSPSATMLGTVNGNPALGAATWSMKMWSDAVTENPAPGGTEVWELYNATGDAHPIHLHSVKFQLLNRQAIAVDDVLGTVQLLPGGVQPPAAWETGFKDTVIALPGQVTRIKALFADAGQFVWHCHIVEHEDNEMMRPFRIGPLQPGQPGAPAAAV